MSLNQTDVEMIERMIQRSSGDIAVALGRGFEQVEERVDSAETRPYSRLADIEDLLQIRNQQNS